tara:strand:- start:1620 stop:2012 length:393 start_codon:yes stop_codon:yes gene_type:complete
MSHISRLLSKLRKVNVEKVFNFHLGCGAVGATIGTISAPILTFRDDIRTNSRTNIPQTLFNTFLGFSTGALIGGTISISGPIICHVMYTERHFENRDIRRKILREKNEIAWTKANDKLKQIEERTKEQKN